jgi:tripartite-type tricarboxylate transporter receptor subunit TctC
MKPLLKLALAFMSSITVLAPVHADQFPSKNITLIVPLAPGGSTDSTARQVADKLRNVLGQSVIVDNRAGAGGNIGAAMVAKAAPDGYTLLMATSTHATNPSLYKTLPYDLQKDLTPVVQIAFIPNVLVVRGDFPAKTLEEFIKYVKEAKELITYGSAGNGTSQHLSGSLFNNMAGGKMSHVPYKGGAPANADLLAGQISAVFAPLVEVLSYIETGRFKALGVTTKTRSPRLPNVPAIDEYLPGYEVVLWNGLFAPANTPPEIVNKLNAAVKKVLQEPDVEKTFAAQGTRLVGNSPAEFKQFVGTEVEKWARLVKISGAVVE